MALVTMIVPSTQTNGVILVRVGFSPPSRIQTLVQKKTKQQLSRERALALAQR